MDKEASLATDRMDKTAPMIRASTTMREDVHLGDKVGFFRFETWIVADGDGDPLDILLFRPIRRTTRRSTTRIWELSIRASVSHR